MEKRDLLMIDAKRDLERVDHFVTTLVADKDLQKRFFDNPHREMIKMGFTPPRRNKRIGMSNRVFYATLANKKLFKFLRESLPKVSLPEDAGKLSASALRKGKVEIDLKASVSALETVWKDQNFNRELLSITLQDLNRKGLLAKRFTEEEVEDYITVILIQIKQGTPAAEIKRMTNMGFGPDQGYSGEGSKGPAGEGPNRAGLFDEGDGGEGGEGGEGPEGPSEGPGEGGEGPGEGGGGGGEGDAVAVSVAIAAVAVFVVVAIIAAVPVFVLGVGRRVLDAYAAVDELVINAYGGDVGSFMAASTLLGILAFSSDLGLYAANIDKEGFFGAP